MKRTRTVILTAMGLAALSGSSSAAAQSFPTFNIKKYCFEQAYDRRVSVDSDFYAQCLSNEIEAGDELNSRWPYVSSGLRRACAPPPPTQAQPEKMTGAYVWMVSCLDRRSW